MKKKLSQFISCLVFLIVGYIIAVFFMTLAYIHESYYQDRHQCKTFYKIEYFIPISKAACYLSEKQ